jgi:hypothetical protein
MASCFIGTHVFGIGCPQGDRRDRGSRKWFVFKTKLAFVLSIKDDQISLMDENCFCPGLLYECVLVWFGEGAGGYGADECDGGTIVGWGGDR